MGETDASAAPGAVDKHELTKRVASKSSKGVDPASDDAGPVSTTSSPVTPSWLRCVMTVYISVSMVSSLLASTFVMLACWVVFLPILATRDSDYDPGFDVILRFFSSFGAFMINPFWKLVETSPPPKKMPSRGAIVMTNHLSAADPWALNHSLRKYMRVKYVYKGSMLKVPVVGWALKLSHDLPIFFTKEKGGWGTEKGCVNDIMTRAAKTLRNGRGIVVFPEGTRSKTGRLQPFKDGFFKFAIENNFPILPIGLHNTQAIWPLKGKTLNTGTAYVGYGNYIEPAGKTVEQLKQEVQRELLRVLALSPEFDAKMEQPLTEAPATRGQGL